MFDIENLDFSSPKRIFIWGLPGHGKTLLLTHFCIQAMIHSSYYIYDIYDEIDELNNMGYSFSKNFEHLMFCNYDVNTDYSELPDFRSYKLDPYRIGFSGKFKTECFPYGSIFGVTEAQNYWPSNMSDYIRPEVKREFQTSRHSGITFIIDAQRPMDVAKCIRELFDVFIECVEVNEIVHDGYVVAHEWTFRIIEGNLVLEQYLRNRDIKLCRQVKFRSKMCYYYNYNSEMCRNLHMKGRENQDFNIRHFGEDEDDDILSTPDGYFIKRSDRVVHKDDLEEFLF